MPTPEGMITVQEAARRLNRSIEQVRRYLREGKLKGLRIGQQWFIEEGSLKLRYQPSGQGLQRIREPAAVMEATRTNKEDIEALIKRIDENREAISRRVGGTLNIDIVEMLRLDREEH